MNHIKKFNESWQGEPDYVYIAENLPSKKREFIEIKDKILAGDVVKIKRYVSSYRPTSLGKVTYKAVLNGGRTIGTSVHYLWDFGDSSSSSGKIGHFLSISDKTFDGIRNEQLSLFNKFHKSGFSTGINYFFDSFNDKYDNPILIDKKSYYFIDSLLEDIYLKKKSINESLFKSNSKRNRSEYKSNHVEVYGDISDSELKMLKAIDICRDSGFNLRDSSGEITDGADVWTYRGNEYLAIKPDYRKGSFKIIDISSNKTISTFEIESPEVMSKKIMMNLN